MICNNCRQQIPDNNRFCPYCGREISAKKKKFPIVPVAITVILLAAIAIGLTFFLKGSSQKKTITVSGKEIPKETMKKYADEAGISVSELKESVECIECAEDLVEELSSDIDYTEEVSEAKAEDIIEELENSRYIRSAEYDEENKCIVYEYDCGGHGVIELVHNEDSFSGRSVTREEAAYTISSGTTGLGGPADVLVLYGFDHEEYFDHLHQYFESLPATVRVETDVTLEMLSHIGGYDVTIFCMHGENSYLGTYLCIGQKGTVLETLKYYKYINRDDIIFFDRCYSVGKGFFSAVCEKDDFSDGVVLVESCNFFGNSDRSEEDDVSFAKTFRDLGAEAAVGFYNPVHCEYSTSFISTVALNILYERAVTVAYDTAVRKYGASYQYYDTDQHGEYVKKIITHACFYGNKNFVISLPASEDPIAVSTAPAHESPTDDADSQIHKAYLEYLLTYSAVRFYQPPFISADEPFKIKSFTYADLTGDGVPELIVADCMPYDVDAAFPRLLVVAAEGDDDSGYKIKPLFVKSLDPVALCYSKIDLVSGRFLLTWGHGTSGSSEEYYISWSDGEALKLYVFHDGNTWSTTYYEVTGEWWEQKEISESDFYEILRSVSGKDYDEVPLTFYPATDEIIRNTPMIIPEANENNERLEENEAKEEAIPVHEITLGGKTFMSDVEELDLWNCGIEDISILADCRNLKKLELGINAIKDISALANLTNLQELDLNDNAIEDVSALANLTNLQVLVLNDNAIQDISALANLTNLKVLCLSSNAINDISALEDLTNLEQLTLDCVFFEDISALAKLTNLRLLFLSVNAIEDISALATLTNLKTLCLSHNAIKDISALANLTNLQELDLNDNAIEDVSALANLTNLQVLVLNDNAIQDVSALANLTNLVALTLDGNNISDYSPVDFVQWLNK